MFMVGVGVKMAGLQILLAITLNHVFGCEEHTKKFFFAFDRKSRQGLPACFLKAPKSSDSKLKNKIMSKIH